MNNIRQLPVERHDLGALAQEIYNAIMQRAAIAKAEGEGQ